MDKNYYDILQVNKNASPEIIEKAYKVLAKKYHPDLQMPENKKQSEDILKQINEAYEILSNPEKKQDYDNFLLENESSSSCSTTFQSTPKDLSQQLKQEQELAYQQELEYARQKAYHDAYIQDLKNRGYKIRYQKSFKDYIKGFFSLLITLLILFLLWQIPFVKNFIESLLKDNELFRFLK